MYSHFSHYLGLPPFLPENEPWRPGYAGPFPRMIAGTGAKHGWLLYAWGSTLRLELWRDYALCGLFMLDCRKLMAVGGNDSRVLRHAVAFGYDLDRESISLGCVTYDTQELSVASAYQDFAAPGLAGYFTQPERTEFGAVDLALDDGATQTRSAWAAVFPVNGRFTSTTPLTAGELARLATELREQGNA